MASTPTDPAEVVRLAAASKRAARVAAKAAALRLAAQAQYDAAVSAQQNEMAEHGVALHELDDAVNGTTSERVLALLSTARDTLVTSHITAVRDLTAAVTELAPQLDVAYWNDAADAAIAAGEAEGE